MRINTGLSVSIFYTCLDAGWFIKLEQNGFNLLFVVSDRQIEGRMMHEKNNIC